MRFVVHGILAIILFILALGFFAAGATVLGVDVLVVMAWNVYYYLTLDYL